MNTIEVEHILLYTPMCTFNLDIDIDEMVNHCLNMSKEKNNRVKSNFGGWQSRDILPNEDSLLDQIFKNNIDNIMQDYCDNFGIKGKTFLTNYWINVNNKHHFNRSHVHPFSFFSGVFYLKVNEDSGNIVFENSDALLIEAYAKTCPNGDKFEQWIDKTNPMAHFLFHTYSIPCKSKLGIIFPAWEKHSVFPNMSDEPRISISFNYKVNFGEN